MNHAELIMRRKNVREFINADQIELVLTREPEPVKNTQTGGYVPGDAIPPLSPQIARVVQNRRRYNNGIVNSEAGDIPDTDYLLLGNYNLDVEVDDTFYWQGNKYKVTGIHDLRTESTLCSIDLEEKVNRPNG
jgi:hypothetical protein